MNMRDEFLRVWPFLAKAILAFGPTHTEGHVWAALEAKHAQLWTTENAAFVSEIKVWPTGFKEAVGWLAGGNMAELLTLQPQFENWAREAGCARVRMISRLGWSRVMTDYSPHGVYLTKDL